MKHFKLSLLSVAIIAVSADAADYGNQTIVVEGSRMRPGVFGVIPDSLALKDTAALLKRIPGAEINRNGPLTGIASYRGLFGDRVNVDIDGAALKGACPNSMDPGLSHVPAILTQNLTVYRGIAPVSSGMETIGGSMKVEARRGEFGETDTFEYHGSASVGFSSVDDGVVAGLINEFSNKQHRFHLNGSYESGNDYSFDGDKAVSPSQYKRDSYAIGYGFQKGAHEVGFNYTNSDTGESGTASLPMDIVYARGGVLSANYTLDLGSGRKLDTKIFYQDIRHLMDNFSSRKNGSVTGKYRESLSTIDGGGFSAVYEMPLYEGSLSLGAAGDYSNHDAQINDPNNAMFYIDNFQGVKRDRHSGFAEWKGQVADNTNIELGLRLTQVKMDAGLVGTSMAMNPNVRQLRDDFNASDRSQEEHNIDLAVMLNQRISDSLSINVGLARKERSASYQERYVWLPLESTGGLADNHVYVGDVNLNAETAYQFELGLEYADGGLYIAPRAFYHRINDYIQGEEIVGTTANMVAGMMTGNSKVLQYTNVDAELQGVDVEWGYELDSSWSLDGAVSYVRGRRRDEGDNLYRIAPFNTRAQLTYAQADWSVATEVEAYSAQNDVASYNQEQKSAGYGLLHIRGEIEPVAGLSIGLGIENILDKQYQDHTLGINRASGSDVAVGEKLSGEGRSFYITADYQW